MRRYAVVPRAVVVCGRHLLLVRDPAGVRPLSPGRWHLPGGEVLEHESPQKAVERLVKLRTGLAVEAQGCLDAVARRGGDPVSGKPAPLLHLFFLCSPAAENDPALLPAGSRDLALPDGGLGSDGGRPAGPPGGADWGWTDLESGLAALKHDIAGEWVVDYLRRRLGDAGAGVGRDGGAGEDGGPGLSAGASEDGGSGLSAGASEDAPAGGSQG